MIDRVALHGVPSDAPGTSVLRPVTPYDGPPRPTVTLPMKRPGGLRVYDVTAVFALTHVDEWGIPHYQRCAADDAPFTGQIPPPDGYDGPGETLDDQAFWRRDTVEEFCRARVSRLTVERDQARAQYEALLNSVASLRSMTTAPLIVHPEPAECLRDLPDGQWVILQRRVRPSAG